MRMMRLCCQKRQRSGMFLELSRQTKLVKVTFQEYVKLTFHKISKKGFFFKHLLHAQPPPPHTHTHFQKRSAAPAFRVYFPPYWSRFFAT